MPTVSPERWNEQLLACIEQLMQGDAQGLAQLFDLTAARLLRYAWLLTRQREDAEDIVQVVMMKIARYPQHFAAARHVWALLLHATRNECLRVLERSRRYPTFSLGDVSPPEPEHRTPVEHLAVASEQQELLLQAVNTLPPEQAEVITLKIWEGLTFQEIATLTGRSLNTVASRYRYALAHLERKLSSKRCEVRYAPASSE
ncbi:MAG: RNA polymerase sigma factor [Planctomycetaceae bacterium]|nr:MAG: RNA polymerase sigma factor [Planctomycetaceae bacterium]